MFLYYFIRVIVLFTSILFLPFLLLIQSSYTLYDSYPPCCQNITTILDQITFQQSLNVIMNNQVLLQQLNRFLQGLSPVLPEDSLSIWESIRPLLGHSQHLSSVFSIIAKINDKIKQPKTSRQGYSSARNHTIINSPSVSSSLKFHELLASANKNQEGGCSNFLKQILAKTPRDKQVKKKKSFLLADFVKDCQLPLQKFSDFQQASIVQMPLGTTPLQAFILIHYAFQARQSFAGTQLKDSLWEVFQESFQENSGGKLAKGVGRVLKERRSCSLSHLTKVARLFMSIFSEDIQLIEQLEQYLLRKSRKVQLKGLSLLLRKRVQFYRVSSKEEEAYGEGERLVVFQRNSKIYLLYPWEPLFQPEPFTLDTDLLEINSLCERRRNRSETPVLTRKGESPLPWTRGGRLLEQTSPKGTSRSFMQLNSALKVRQALNQISVNSNKLNNITIYNGSKGSLRLADYADVYAS